MMWIAIPVKLDYHTMFGRPKLVVLSCTATDVDDAIQKILARSGEKDGQVGGRNIDEYLHPETKEWIRT